MPYKSGIIFLLVFFINNATQAQKKKGPDVGINITSVISTFIGNDNDIEARDIPFMLRFGEANKIRLGIGAGVKSNQFFDVITQATRNSDEHQFLLRFGFQKDIFTEKKWGVYWGLDAIGSYALDRVRSQFGNIGENRILTETIGLGGGPLVGMTFNITDRIYFSTESTLYAIFKIVQDRERGFGLPTTKVTTFNYDIQTAPPLFLYLNYAF